jgi:D-tyrosyl-tRNA(Tyr) deacylase
MLHHPPQGISTFCIAISAALLFHCITGTAMRLVVQRVKSAHVSVQQKQVSAIGPGIVALVGLHLEDTESDLQFCSTRLLALKLYENDSGTFWRQHVKQKGYEILCVSQFTLYGTLSKKNQPDYSLAMKADQAKTMYHRFLEMLKEGYADGKILDGRFGEMMEVGLVNDGPVTLVIDSREGMERKMSSMSLSNDGE